MKNKDRNEIQKESMNCDKILKQNDGHVESS